MKADRSPATATELAVEQSIASHLAAFDSTATLVGEELGGEIVGLAVVIDLPDVGGRQRIEALGHKLVALCQFQGE